MDISMPVMDGIEATRKIRKEHPHIQVIGLSMYDDRKMAEEIMGGGAKTLVRKDAPSDLLLAAIKAA